MDAQHGSSREHRAMQADAFYRNGLELKASKQPDRALTEFRRAVLADPDHASSHYEISLLTKSRADADSYFLRYAFEAFRNAARLDLNNQQAHDQYIIVGHKMGKLDEIHREYDALAKANPDNPVFERCAKNIVTLSMALIPEQVNIGSMDTGNLRKVVLFVSIGLILFGVGLALYPVLTGKYSGIKMEPAVLKRFVRLGLIAIAGGIGGFFVRGRLGRQ